MEDEVIENLMGQSQLQGQATQTATALAQQNYMVQEQDKNLAETQLDVDEILQEINHRLRQDILEEVDGNLKWNPIADKKERVLTDLGVERIMQMMKSYINKNTLLSNFGEKQINQRMLEFCLSLSGLILMKYEFYFREPTFEECKEIIERRIENKIKLKQFSMEVLGQKPDEKEIKKELLAKMEGQLEKEFNNIRQEKRKQNLREFEMMFTELKAQIEATHNRAWKGEERGSLRRHTQISEILGKTAPVGKQEGGWMSAWGRR